MRSLKQCKGSIMITLLVALMVFSMGISLYTAFIKDKHSTNLYIDRINARTDINTYITMSRNFLYSYFANKEVELMYRQTVGIDDSGDDVIKRTLITNPYYINIEDLSVSEYKGEQKYVLREDDVLNFAGYQFNMKVYLDIPIDEAEEKLKVLNNALTYNAEFMDDVNNIMKDEDAYSISIGDIPVIVVHEYDTWVQETKIVISGLKFQREHFPILYYALDGSLQGNVSEGAESTATGVVDGYLITDNIVFETIESQRARA